MTQIALEKNSTVKNLNPEVIRCRPSYLDETANLSAIHYPVINGPWFIHTSYHFEINMKLTPCASALWEWILLKAPAGQMIDIRLKDFQSVSGEYRSKPYCMKQIRRAVRELENLQLIEISEETLKMSARHPGPVTNSSSKSRRTNKSSAGTLMSDSGTLMSTPETKMSQATAVTFVPQAFQPPTDHTNIYRSSSDQAAAEINNANTIGFEGQIKVETYGSEATGFKGNIEVETYNADATGFKGGIEAVAYGATATGFEGNIEAVAHNGKATGFKGDVEVEAYGGTATGFKGDIEVRSSTNSAVGFEGNIKVVSHQSIIDAIKKLLGIAKLSYAMRCQLESASFEVITATITCYKQDLAEWRGEMHSPTGYFINVLRQCKNGRRPVEQYEVELEPVDPVDEALSAFQRWWLGAPVQNRPFLLRDIERDWSGKIAVLDPAVGPVRIASQN